MKTCQIATVGENIEWILKGLFLFRAQKLILISSSDPVFISKIKDIKDKLIDPKFEVKPIEIENKLIEGEDPLLFITQLKNTILENIDQGYHIDINVTAGPSIWQVFGYFVKIQLKNLIRNYFIINKRSGDPIIFPSSILSKTEQMILDIVGSDKHSIEQIKLSYEMFKGKKISSTLISKYLTKLKEKELIQEFNHHKLKNFELSVAGKMYQIDPKIYLLKG